MMTRQEAVSRVLASEAVERRAKAARQIKAWRRYALRPICGKSASLIDGTWLVCIRPKGHEHACESGGGCIFDPEED